MTWRVGWTLALLALIVTWGNSEPASGAPAAYRAPATGVLAVTPHGPVCPAEQLDAVTVMACARESLPVVRSGTPLAIPGE